MKREDEYKRKWYLQHYKWCDEKKN